MPKSSLVLENLGDSMTMRGFINRLWDEISESTALLQTLSWKTMLGHSDCICTGRVVACSSTPNSKDTTTPTKTTNFNGFSKYEKIQFLPLKPFSPNPLVSALSLLFAGFFQTLHAKRSQRWQGTLTPRRRHDTTLFHSLRAAWQHPQQKAESGRKSLKVWPS